MNMKETILKVEGMTCSACVRHVESALRTIDGVGAVEVKLGEGEARVQYDSSKAPVARLIEAIDDAGYEARVSEPP